MGIIFVTALSLQAALLHKTPLPSSRENVASANLRSAGGSTFARVCSGQPADVCVQRRACSASTMRNGPSAGHCRQFHQQPSSLRARAIERPHQGPQYLPLTATRCCSTIGFSPAARPRTAGNPYGGVGVGLGQACQPLRLMLFVCHIVRIFLL